MKPVENGYAFEGILGKELEKKFKKFKKSTDRNSYIELLKKGDPKLYKVMLERSEQLTPIIVNHFCKKTNIEQSLLEILPGSFTFNTANEGKKGNIADLCLENNNGESFLNMSIKWNNLEIKSFRLSSDPSNFIDRFFSHKNPPSSLKTFFEKIVNDFNNLVKNCKCVNCCHTNCVNFEKAQSWDNLKNCLTRKGFIKHPVDIYQPVIDGLIALLISVKNDPAFVRNIYSKIFGTPDYVIIYANKSKNSPYLKEYSIEYPTKITEITKIKDNSFDIDFEKGPSLNFRIKNGDTNIKNNVLSGFKFSITVKKE